MGWIIFFGVLVVLMSIIIWIKFDFTVAFAIVVCYACGMIVGIEITRLVAVEKLPAKNKEDIIIQQKVECLDSKCDTMYYVSIKK